MSGRANTSQLRTKAHVPNSKTKIVELVGQGIAKFVGGN
jgi:hypothetical protein